MPSKKARGEISTFIWCVLSLVVLHVVGGGVFSMLEREAELQRYAKNRYFYHQMKEMYEFDGCSNAWMKENYEFCKNQGHFGKVFKRFMERTGNEMEDQEKWTFMGSVFFVCTLVTTLGYGNFHPTTPSGQAFTVVFGLFGIPVMGYTLSQIARFVVDVWMPMLPCIDTRNRRMLALVILLLILILSGGVLFMFLEGWSFLQACYFATCTLLSIGFGDFLPRTVFSRSCTMVFILLGLGVAASFIAVLQIHVEIRGEAFAKNLNNWYNSVSEGCGGSNRAIDASAGNRA